MSKNVEFKLTGGNWYKFILTDDTEMIVRFIGGDENGIRLIGCDGGEKPFVAFKSITDLGDQRPC